jgi:hypothetical protein
MSEKPVIATVTRVGRKIPVVAISQCGEMVLIIGEGQDAEQLGFEGSLHSDEVVVQVSLQRLEESLAKAKADRFNV